MAEELGALVAGAGPTGLTMAAELARFGVATRIVDRAPAPSATSKAFAVQARTLEEFVRMGLAERFVAEGLHAHGINIFGEGDRLAHVSFDGIESRFPFVLSIAQSRTEQLLGEHLTALGVTVERDVRLTAFRDDGEGVDAGLARGDGGTERVRARWLIGCDGAHSTVRHALDLPFEGNTVDASFALADVKLDWSMPDDEISVFLHHGDIAGFFPIPGKRFRIVVERQKASPPGDPTLDEFTAAMQEMGAPPAALSDPIWLSRFTINERRVTRYGRGRVFVAGDAAHIHSPVGGQGMNTGIQDACNLAWKLALNERGLAPCALVESYRAEREGVGAALLRDTSAATKMALLRNPVSETIRNRALRLLSAFEPMQDRIRAAVSELAVAYRNSPIVRDDVAGLDRFIHHAWGAQAGDRAPEVLARRQRDGVAVSPLDLLQDLRHVLLLFAGASSRRSAEAAAVADLVARSYGATIACYEVSAAQSTPDPDSAAFPAGWERLYDDDGSFHRAFGAVEDQLVLIRPDGYLAYRGLPVDARRFAAYLQTVFT